MAKLTSDTQMARSGTRTASHRGWRPTMGDTAAMRVTNSFGRFHRIAAVSALAAVGVLSACGGGESTSTPSTAPTSTPTTRQSLPSTVPASAPVTGPPDSVPPESTTPIASGAEPRFLYVGDVLSSDFTERVVDLATGAVVRTEDRNGVAYPENWLARLTRTDSAVRGITYHKQGFEDLGAGDFIDLCGQGRIVLGNAPAGDLALPDRAMDLVVSPDGRWVVVASTVCPVDGAMVVGVGVPADMPEYEVRIRVFDADDPSVPGRLLTTTSTAIAEVPQFRFSADGHWAALSSYQGGTGPTLEVFDLTTARAVAFVQSDDGCTLIGYGQQDGLFVGNDAVAELKRCSDVVIVEITLLTDPTEPARFTLPNVTASDTLWGTLEVWPALPDDVRDATFVASIGELGVRDSGRTFFGSGGRVEELPFSNTHISFEPLPLFIGGS